MPKKPKKRAPIADVRTIVLACVAFAAFVAVSVASMSMYNALFPRVLSGTYSFSATATGGVAFRSFPLAVPLAPRMIYPISATIRVPYVHAGYYTVSADDCLESLSINERVVPLAYPICDYHKQFVVDLGDYVRPGENRLVALVGNGGGLTRFDIAPSYRDPIVLFFPALIALFWCAVVYAMLRLLRIGTTLERAELVLCALYLLGRAWLLFRTSGWVRGFDVGPHLEMVARIDLLDWLNIGVKQLFYSYHPPIGFVAAKALHLSGVGLELSVYVVSFCATFGTFLYARAFLKEMGFLDRIGGVVFLYLFSSFPAVVFLSSSVNLESIVLFFGVAALYHATLGLRPSGGHMRLAHCCLCVLMLVCGLLTKFNGIIALAVPVVSVLFFSRNERTLRVVGRAACISLAAAALVSPYYVLRNVAQTGDVFPANTEWVQPAALREARVMRDEDTSVFLRKLVTPDWNVLFSPRSAENVYRNHDYATPRLWDAWKFLWISDRNPLYQGPESIAVSIVYIQVMPWLMLLGSLLWAWSLLYRSSQWDWFGVYLFALALLNVLALALFAYTLPYAAFAPIKAIYLPFVMPWVAYVISRVVSALPDTRWWYAAPVFLVAGIVFVNHVLIVY